MVELGRSVADGVTRAGRFWRVQSNAIGIQYWSRTIGNFNGRDPRITPLGMAALHLLMLSCTLSAALALRPPDPLVVGASECAVYTFAKLQRAAQLPGAGFRGPKAFGAAEKELQSVLWSQFGMANAAAYDLADRSRLNQLRNIEGGKVVSAGLDALLFLDTFPSAQKQFSVPFFGKKATAATPPPLDQDALQLAAAKGMTHAYIALTSSTELADCVAFLRSQCPDLMATVVVPEAGVRVECRSGWNSLLAQDLGGELVDGLCVRDGLVQMEEGAELRAIAPEARLSFFPLPRPLPPTLPPTHPPTHPPSHPLPAGLSGSLPPSIPPDQPLPRRLPPDGPARTRLEVSEAPPPPRRSSPRRAPRWPRRTSPSSSCSSRCARRAQPTTAGSTAAMATFASCAWRPRREHSCRGRFGPARASSWAGWWARRT